MPLRLTEGVTDSDAVLLDVRLRGCELVGEVVLDASYDGEELVDALRTTLMDWLVRECVPIDLLCDTI